MQVADSPLQSSLESAPLAGPLAYLRKALKIGSTPCEVIHREPALSVLRYHNPPDAPVTHPLPIVLVPSLINRHYVLDLLPGKSLVEYFLSQGFAVYLLRWESPEDEDRWLTPERLIAGRMHRAFRSIQKDSQAAEFHLVGHCLGGTLATIYSVLHPERIRSLTQITAPVDFINVGQLANWAQPSALDLQALLDAYGNMPWILMQSAFQLLRPVAGVSKYFRMAKRIQDKALLKNFLALEFWINDNFSFPGGCFQTIIGPLYRQNSLVRGGLRMDGREILLSKLEVPVLNIHSPQDHIVPPQTTMRDDHLRSGRVVDQMEVQGGHIGCLIGKRAQKTLWPKLADWIKAHGVDEQ